MLADSLVCFQARNNARAVVAGSIDMFSNEYFRTTLGGRYVQTRSLDWWYSVVFVLSPSILH